MYNFITSKLKKDLAREDMYQAQVSEQIKLRRDLKEKDLMYMGDGEQINRTAYYAETAILSPFPPLDRYPA